MAAHKILLELRAIRIAEGISQADMADAIQMPSGQPYIARIENGGHDPLLATVSDWANALGYELTLRKRKD